MAKKNVRNMEVYESQTDQGIFLFYGNLTTQTIGKCVGFRLCHDKGSACYS